MNNIEKKLWSKAKVGGYLLGFVPFIKMIAVNGSLALGKSNEDSDIDFFIITDKNRLWIVRFLSIIILDLFFLRAKNSNHRGKICLNHYLSSCDYILTPQNKYNAYQYSNLEIIYGIGMTYEEFISKNQWMKRYCQTHKKYQANNKSNIIKLVSEYFLAGHLGDKLEKKIFNFQTKRIQDNPFFHLEGSVLKISENEFYYYTDADKKYSKFSY